MTGCRSLAIRAVVVGALALAVLAASESRQADAAAIHRTAADRPAAHVQAKAMYWGAWIGSQLTGREAPWDVRALSAFDHENRKGASLVNFSSPWQNCSSDPCTFYSFDATAMDNIRRRGAIPFFSWGSDSLPVSVHEPDLSLATIIAGKWDAYVTSWATAAKQWGHPFFLRFDWEMNGNWFPWSVGVNGNTSSQYIRAWRHVHDIFTSVGATNVTWVWCPNVDPKRAYAPLSSVYPGDGYVDWTGLDGYNWGKPWMTFDQLFRSTYTQLVTEVAPGKPVVIGETASTGHRRAKGPWITHMLTSALPHAYPRIKAFLWFDKLDSGMDWTLEGSSSARAAFAAGIAAQIYASNRFGALTGGKIRPLA